jgi:hypothetical protein
MSVGEIMLASFPKADSFLWLHHHSVPEKREIYAYDKRHLSVIITLLLV